MQNLFPQKKEQFIKLAGYSCLFFQREFPTSFPSFLLLCVCLLTLLFSSFPTTPERSGKAENYPSNSSQSFAAYQVLQLHIYFTEGIPHGSHGKASACQCGRPGFDPWVGKIPWRREWQPTPIFLTREIHEQRRQAGYSPWGRKELDTTEQLTHTHTCEM